MIAMWPLIRKKQDDAINVRLVSADLFLRPARYNDCDEWISVRAKNQAYLKPFEPRWPDNCLSEDFFIRRVQRLNQDWLSDHGYAFLIFEKETGALAGGININNVARGAGRMASLGYWIDQDRQGRGWMTQSARTVLAFAFSGLQLERMNAATLPHNHKSRNMLRRVGFVEEGFAKSYIQINGKREDHVLYGLNASDFLSAPHEA